MSRKIVYKNTKISADRWSNRKAIVRDTLNKKTLNEKERKYLLKVQRQQNQLIKMKSEYRKSTNKTEQQRQDIKKLEKKVFNSFNKFYGLKYGKRGNLIRQTKEGRSRLYFNKEGLATIEKKKYVKPQNLPQYLAFGSIDSYEEFVKNKKNIQDILSEYNASAYFDEFINDTSTSWMRRIMNRIGISPTVSRESFKKWLIRSGIK